MYWMIMLFNSGIADESLIVNRTITYASNSKKSWFKNSHCLYFKNTTINAIAFKFRQYKSLHVPVRIYCQAPTLYYNFVHAQGKFCSSIKFCLWIYPAKYIYLGFFCVLWTQDLQSFTVNLLLRIVIVTKHGVALDSRLVDWTERSLGFKL